VLWKPKRTTTTPISARVPHRNHRSGIAGNVETKIIAARAYKWFIEGDFSVEKEMPGDNFDDNFITIEAASEETEPLEIEAASEETEPLEIEAAPKETEHPCTAGIGQSNL